MNPTDYASILGTLRVAEKKLLQTDGIERVIETNSPEEAARAVAQASEYDFTALKRPGDYESVLSKGLKDTYAYLYKIAPQPEVIDIVLAKYDFHNVKVALKSKFLNTDSEGLYVGYTPVDSAEIKAHIIEGAKPEKVPPHLVRAAAEAAVAYEAANNPQALDIAVDRAMFAYQLELANNAVAFIAEYVALMIDFHNIKTLLRVKNMDRDLRFLRETLVPGGKLSLSYLTDNFDKDPVALADTLVYKYFGDILKISVDNYEKTGNFSMLVRMFDNYLIEHLKASKYISMGPELLLSYVLSKENEARQIRIIMTCKLNDIPNAVLRERLRDNHV